MERIFFGLSSKNGAGTSMKEDAADRPEDPVRGSGMKWSFSNKVSALPQFLSFNQGYMTISTKDAFESNQKPFFGVVQKNLSIGNQAGNNHGMTVYPPQVSPVFQSNLAATGTNMITTSVIKPQPLGSKSSSTPVSVLPSTGSIVGSTDLRNSSKSTATPAQLTIFYAGSVCVYDDISPEKAQAIMLLAGNGSTPSQNKTVSTTSKLKPAISIPSKDDGFIISQSYPSALPSPLPVTSHASSLPRECSSSNIELAAIRPLGPSATPTQNLESPNVVGSVGSSASKMVQSGLPQARKASLARFLEKRKERVVSTSPYYVSKKSPQCSIPGSDAISFSLNSSGSCSLPASN